MLTFQEIPSSGSCDIVPEECDGWTTKKHISSGHSYGDFNSTYIEPIPTLCFTISLIQLWGTYSSVVQNCCTETVFQERITINLKLIFSPIPNRYKDMLLWLQKIIIQGIKPWSTISRSIFNSGCLPSSLIATPHQNLPFNVGVYVTLKRYSF